MKKGNFKIKDKVRILRNSYGSCNEVGDIGVIKEISSLGSLKVFVEGRNNSNNWSHRDELELVVDDSVTRKEFRHFLSYELDFTTYDELVDECGVLNSKKLFKVLSNKYNLTHK